MRRAEVLAQLLLASLAAVLVVSVVYVGSWRWTAPVVCPNHQSDGFVVKMPADSVGAAIPRYSLHCMGDRGAYSEVGAWKPMAVLLATLYGVVVLVTLLWWRLLPS